MSVIGTRGVELVLRSSAIMAALVGALLAGGGVWVFPICAAGFELVGDHRKGLALLATPVLLAAMPMTSAVLLWIGTTILFALPVALSAEAPRSGAPLPTQEAQSLLGAEGSRTHLAVLGVSAAATGPDWSPTIDQSRSDGGYDYAADAEVVQLAMQLVGGGDGPRGQGR